MTFLRHTAKSKRSSTASSQTLGGHGGLAAREERRFPVAQALRIAPAAAQPDTNSPRSYFVGDPWRGSGP